jgi:dihydroflavonol-4-reductase
VGRALVTGGAGFLGRHLVAALLAEGTPTTALCRRPEGLAGLAHPNLALEIGDVRDDALCARVLAGVDAVFHLAAVRNRPGARATAMAAVNEAATLRLASQAAEAGVGRFVNVSSAHVFGPSTAPLDETAPLVLDGSAGAYGESRGRAVVGLRGLVRAGAPIVTLYPTILFGPDHPTCPNRVTSQVRRLLRRRVEVVVGDGRARRDLVHVADVVTAALAARRLPDAAGLELLVAGEAVSQRGLGELVARCAGRPRPRVIPLPVPVARNAARLLDGILGYDPRCGWATAVYTLSQEWSFRADKARAVLGYRPRPLAQGIAETVAWIRGGRRDDQ